MPQGTDFPKETSRSRNQLNGRTQLLDVDNDQQQAQKTLKRVLDAIEKRDKIALKSVFSKKALNESIDIDKEIEALFNFYEGNLISWQENELPQTSDHIQYGSLAQRRLVFCPRVITDKKKYFFGLLDFPVDKENPDNQGLYALLVIYPKDEKHLNNWQNEFAGIRLRNV